MLLSALAVLVLAVAPAHGQSSCAPSAADLRRAAPPPPRACPLEPVGVNARFPVASAVRRPRCNQQTAEPCVLCERVRCQVSRACGMTAGRHSAYAETVFLRRQLAPPLAEETRRAITAAQLSQSPALALELLADARRSADPVERFAAGLTTAYVLVKADPAENRTRLGDVIAELRRGLDRVPLPTADVDFLEATIAAYDGNNRRALQLLDVAVAKESGFFAALVLATRLQLMETRVAAQTGGGACREEFRRLFGYLVLLMDVQPCPRQAAHVETFLARQLKAPDDEPAFLSAQVYLSLIARQPALARARLERLRAAPTFSCRDYVARQLEGVVDHVARSN